MDAKEPFFQSVNCKNAAKEWENGIGNFEDRLFESDHALLGTCNLHAKMRGLDRCPVLFIATEDCESSVARLVQETAAETAIGFLICLTEKAFQRFADSQSIPRYRVLVLSPSDQRLVVQNRGYLLHLVRKQIPFRKLIPFSISDPPSSTMFVGRASELRSLVDENQDFALCGPGGIGKTSLLHQMQRTLRLERSPRASRIVVVDLIRHSDPYTAATEIAWRVQPTPRSYDKVGLENLEMFLKHVKSTDIRFHDGPIDLIIDEADAVLEGDSLDEDFNGKPFPLMRCLRHLRNLGTCRLTLSGRTKTAELIRSPANPFAVGSNTDEVWISRIKLLPIGPLLDCEAKQLLLQPFEDLGVLNASLSEQILAQLKQCQGIPNRIQNAGLDIANQVARDLDRERST